MDRIDIAILQRLLAPLFSMHERRRLTEIRSPSLREAARAAFEPSIGTMRASLRAFGHSTARMKGLPRPPVVLHRRALIGYLGRRTAAKPAMSREREVIR